MTTTLNTPATATTSKLNASDRKLFRGTAAEVQPWMSDSEILASIGCNFNVIRTPASADGRIYPDCQLWLRDDNREMLGFFGSKRQVIQPSVFIDYFRAFCDASDKAISLDVIGSYNKGRSLYMAAKLNGNNGALMEAGGGLRISQRGHSAYISKEDRTDHWLILSESFGESLRPRVSVVANELICANGLARRVTECDVKLSHTQCMSKDIVHAVLTHAVQQCQAYERMKERLITTEISMDTARKALHDYFGNEQGTGRLAQRLEQIYTHELIGGELDTRGANAWRLASAVTQYTSHEKVRDGETAFRSQLEGARARTANDFIAFLEEQFTGSRELIAA